MQEITKNYYFQDSEIIISTGKIALLASSSIFVKTGGTSLLITVTIEEKETDQDFFPLSVEYIEKMYARGVISTSPFKKREGIPNDDAIIKARQVDHSIRSLFPKNYKFPISVVITVLSYDLKNDPECIAVFGTSLALMLSGAPFYGPASSVVMNVNPDQSISINKLVNERNEDIAEIVISGTDEKFLNIEGWACEISESKMSEVLDLGLESIKKLNDIQRDFYRTVKNTGYVYTNVDKEQDAPENLELINYIKENWYKDIEAILFTEDKFEKNKLYKATLESILAKFKEELNKDALDSSQQEIFNSTENQIESAIEYISRKILRSHILTTNTRRANRKIDEIRTLYAEVDTVPYVHGSALFCRGLTQSLSIATLGSLDNGLMIEGMEGEETKRFMHHYNMPNYSTGETGKFSYHPNRREIGHGSIGENALKNMIPNEEEFPYTIRVVSEIMTSNGSTSMAATCASSMALMAAGVPLKEHVAGISIGLVIDDSNPENYKLLMDIEGIEDFYGDMDFKIAGTKNGITAIQYENKIRGVDPKIIKEAFQLAKQGRLEILDLMYKVISSPRELPSNAPVVGNTNIHKDEIGAFIGPGGKNIKNLIDRSGEFGNKASINIEENGKVRITASNREQLKFILEYINKQHPIPEMNKVYKGVISKVTNYGVFVDVSSSISGLCHISEITNHRVDPQKLSKCLSEGMEVNVKIINIGDDGKINFSIKGVDQNATVQRAINAISK